MSYYYDPIDILLPGGVAVVTVRRERATQTWALRYTVGIMLRRPWEKDPPVHFDAAMHVGIGRRSFSVQGSIGSGLHRP